VQVQVEVRSRILLLICEVWILVTGNGFGDGVGWFEPWV
jgi:hypothetical protein